MMSAGKKKTDPERGVGRPWHEDWDEAVSQRFGLKAELPSPFHRHEDHGKVSALGGPQRACTLLLQILLRGNLRKHRRLQCVDDMLRGHGAGEEAGKKAQEGDKHDRERCRRPGSQLMVGK